MVMWPFGKKSPPSFATRLQTLEHELRQFMGTMNDNPGRRNIVNRALADVLKLREGYPIKSGGFTDPEMPQGNKSGIRAALAPVVAYKPNEVTYPEINRMFHEAAPYEPPAPSPVA